MTIAPEDTSVTLPHYATRKNYRGCTDPEQSTATPNVTATQGLTQKQIYSVEQIIEAQNKESSRMSKGPYVKDMFALLPVKIAQREIPMWNSEEHCNNKRESILDQ